MLPHANTNASLNFTNVSFAQQIGPTYRCLKPQGTQTNACLGEFSRLTSQKKQQSEELQHTGRCQCSPVVFGVVCVCKWKDRRLNQVPRITHNCCFLCNRHGTVWNLVQNLVKTSVTSWRLAD